MNEVVKACDLESLYRESLSARPRDGIKLSLTCRLPGFDLLVLDGPVLKTDQSSGDLA